MLLLENGGVTRFKYGGFEQRRCPRSQWLLYCWEDWNSVRVDGARDDGVLCISRRGAMT
jgi:hypothetical protein